MEDFNRLDLSIHTLKSTRGKGTPKELLRREGSTFLVLCGAHIVGSKAS